jgi:hypothetical protein
MAVTLNLPPDIERPSLARLRPEAFRSTGF